jgi:hypothetical protein
MARYSRSRNGGKIIWIAREKVGREWQVVARGDTLADVKAKVEPSPESPPKKSRAKK